MADFAKWSMAAALGRGGNTDEFVKDFDANVERQNKEAIDASVVATVLLAFLGNDTQWQGQPLELYAKLKEMATEMKIPPKSFPGSASIKGRRLREIRPNLAAMGWEIEFAEGHQRQITITRKAPENDAHEKPSDFTGKRATRATPAVFPPFSGDRAVDDNGSNWETGKQKDGHNHVEKDLEKEIDDGFEDVPK